MEDEVRQRFERIEASLDRTTSKLETMADTMMEIQAAQKNTEAKLNRFAEDNAKAHRDYEERFANTQILLDQLIKRDLERGQ